MALALNQIVYQNASKYRCLCALEQKCRQKKLIDVSQWFIERFLFCRTSWRLVATEKGGRKKSQRRYWTSGEYITAGFAWYWSDRLSEAIFATAWMHSRFTPTQIIYKWTVQWHPLSTRRDQLGDVVSKLIYTISRCVILHIHTCCTAWCFTFYSNISEIVRAWNEKRRIKIVCLFNSFSLMISVRHEDESSVSPIIKPERMLRASNISAI